MPGDFGRRVEALVTEKVAPALDRQIAELARQRAHATSDAGVWKLPDGEAYYAWALKAGTTTTRTPDQVHAQGLEELRALQSEMDAILRRQGLTRGTVGARMTALGRDPRQLFPNTDAGREQLLDYMRARIDDMRTRLPRAFATLVRGNLVVKRVPPEIEIGAAGAYAGAGTIDGTVPGNLYVNLHDTTTSPRFGLSTLAYHEGIPGHVWQGEYTYRLPLVRSLLAFNAYSEGWALYAEQLGDELGCYEGDPLGRLGYLQSIAFRACRLVVDTGLHAKRWTRERAIQWFATTNGSPRGDVESEVDRYCASRILLTNDDGVNATGLKLLETIARVFSDDIWIVAPTEEQSGAGHSLTLTVPIRLRKLGERRFCVTGTPTDAVMMGLAHILEDGKPDLILSGVNRGANLGEDVTYSGTVSAAMEGALAGIPSIALSQNYAREGMGDTVPFAAAEAWAERVLRPLIDTPMAPRTLVNVNFPALPPDEVKGVRVVRQGMRDYGRLRIDKRTDTRGYDYYWFGLRPVLHTPGHVTDLEAIADGYVTVTRSTSI